MDIDFGEVLDKFGWPTLFVIGLIREWWHLGKNEWKEIALRSIEANERLASAQMEVVERRIVQTEIAAEERRTR